MKRPIILFRRSAAKRLEITYNTGVTKYLFLNTNQKPCSREHEKMRIRIFDVEITDHACYIDSVNK